jgi:hypothetical protein
MSTHHRPIRRRPCSRRCSLLRSGRRAAAVPRTNPAIFFFRCPRVAGSDFLPLQKNARGTERRKAHLSLRRVAGTRRVLGAPRLAALHRGDFWLQDRDFRDSGGLFRSLWRGRFFPRALSRPAPDGRPLVVGADGDPKPPGTAVANRAAGATPIELDLCPPRPPEGAWQRLCWSWRLCSSSASSFPARSASRNAFRKAPLASGV